MNEHLKEFLKELSKKKWKQCAGALCRGKTYSALGVMCELYIKKNEGSIEKCIDNIGCTYYKEVNAEFGRHYGYPPAKVIEFFGLTTEITHRISKMNDAGKTFKEIKEWLIVSSKVSESK